MQNIPKLIWVFWDKGYEKMPPLIKEIYENNIIICKKYNYQFNLITLENINNYLCIPDRVYHLEFIQQQSDYIRYNLIYKYGGLWLDSDFIIFSNPDALFNLLIDKQLLIMEEFCGKIGNAVLLAQKETSVLKLILEHLENEIYRQDLYWGSLGPDLIMWIQNVAKDDIYIITGEITEKSMNIAGWQYTPGMNIESWYKNSIEEAKKIAQQIITFQIPIIGTWTIYRIHNEMVGLNMIKMVLYDEKSIFSHLLKINEN